MLTTLDRFISKSANYTLHFYRLLMKKNDSEWTTDCEDTFRSLKNTLATSPLLTIPSPREVFHLYLVVAKEAVTVVFIRETDAHQRSCTSSLKH